MTTCLGTKCPPWKTYHNEKFMHCMKTQGFFRCHYIRIYIYIYVYYVCIHSLWVFIISSVFGPLEFVSSFVNFMFFLSKEIVSHRQFNCFSCHAFPSSSLEGRTSCLHPTLCKWTCWPAGFLPRSRKTPAKDPRAQAEFKRCPSHVLVWTQKKNGWNEISEYVFLSLWSCCLNMEIPVSKNIGKISGDSNSCNWNVDIFSVLGVDHFDDRS